MNQRILMCGCGKHQITQGDEPLQIWHGKYWRIECCLRFAITVADSTIIELQTVHITNKSLQHTLKEIRQSIAKLPCHHCDSAVGVNFEFHGSSIYCKQCLTEITVDIGGEG